MLKQLSVSLWAIYLSLLAHATAIDQPTQSLVSSSRLEIYQEKSYTQPRCLFGLGTAAIYCTEDTEQTKQVANGTRLATLKEIGEIWQQLTVEAIHYLHARRDFQAQFPSENDTRPDVKVTNNMALVCYGGEDPQKETNECQKYFGYYCDASGNLKTTADDIEEACESCDCIDLQPKFGCMIGITGGVYCRRDLDDFSLMVNPTILERDPTVIYAERLQPVLEGDLEWTTAELSRTRVGVTDIGATVSITPNSVDLNSVQDSHATALSGELAGRGEQIERYNDYAMVCLGNKQDTALCQRMSVGYYCDRTGALRHTGSRLGACEDYCDCHNLRPKQNCILALTDWTTCVRSLGEDEKELDTLSMPYIPGVDELSTTASVTTAGMLLEPDTKPAGPLIIPEQSAATRATVPEWLSQTIETIVGLKKLVARVQYPRRNDECNSNPFALGCCDSSTHQCGMTSAGSSLSTSEWSTAITTVAKAVLKAITAHLV